MRVEEDFLFDWPTTERVRIEAIALNRRLSLPLDSQCDDVAPNASALMVFPPIPVPGDPQNEKTGPIPIAPRTASP